MELTFSAATGSQLYIRTIDIIVPIIYQIGDVVDLVLGGTGGSVHIEGSTGVYKGIEVDATNGKFYDNANSFQVITNTILKIPSVQGASAQITYYSGNSENAATIVPAGEDGVITVTFTTQTYITAITII